MASSLLVRSVLSPLKLAPSSFAKVHVLLSPSFDNDAQKHASSSNGDAAASSSIAAPFLPSTTLPKLVEKCPSLSSGSFHPSPQLPSGHLQTIYSTLADTVDSDVVHYTRTVLLLPESGIISLDVCDHEPDYQDEQRPTVMILHGLTGGSQESYVRHCLKTLALPRSQGGPGYRCIVVNFRGCANTPVTSTQLYSAAKTSDFRCALLYVRSKYPHSPMVGVGFSLGANVLAKYLGEEGDESPLLGGIVCAAPFHLKKGSDLMENNAFRRHVYSRAMNGNLSRLGTRHAATLDLNESMREYLDILMDPKLGQEYAKQRADLSASSNKTLKFVDDCLTRFVGGYGTPYDKFPFESADDYYKYGGALNFLHNLKRPLLALNADDDPIVAADSVAGVRHLMGHHNPSEKEQYGHTDFIVLATTQGGGHLGWWEGVRRPTRWLHTPVAEFVKALLSESANVRANSGDHKPHPANARPTTTRQVVVELMPAELLPPYLTPQQRIEAGGNAKLQAALARDHPTYRRGPRLPWLRTKVVEQTSLLHPSMARQGWRGDAPLDEPEFSLNTEGQIADASKHDVSEGWCAFEGTMTLDASGARPEVGFLALPAWTRVAGAGEHFQGGKSMPGLYNDGETTSSGGEAKGDAMISGL